MVDHQITLHSIPPGSRVAFTHKLRASSAMAAPIDCALSGMARE
jgi:hypothetical protein